MALTYQQLKQKYRELSAQWVGDGTTPESITQFIAAMGRVVAAHQGNGDETLSEQHQADLNREFLSFILDGDWVEEPYTAVAEAFAEVAQTCDSLKGVRLTAKKMNFIHQNSDHFRGGNYKGAIVNDINVLTHLVQYHRIPTSELVLENIEITSPLHVRYFFEGGKAACAIEAPAPSHVPFAPLLIADVALNKNKQAIADISHFVLASPHALAQALLVCGLRDDLNISPGVTLSGVRFPQNSLQLNTEADLMRFLALEGSLVNVGLPVNVQTIDFSGLFVSYDNAQRLLDAGVRVEQLPAAYQTGAVAGPSQASTRAARWLAEAQTPAAAGRQLAALGTHSLGGASAGGGGAAAAALNDAASAATTPAATTPAVASSAAPTARART